MPFRSKKQMRYMFSQHPDIAERWAREQKAKGQPLVVKSKKKNKRKK